MAVWRLLWSFTLVCYLFVISNNNNNNGVVVMVEAFHKVYPEELQSLSAVSVSHVHRTGFHFQPPRHWINDPNGPMFFNGVYHLFYQYNPKGAVWGNIVWAHSVSRDMINWIAVEPAIYPSKPFDIKGCWSGSATILKGNKPVILYTGVNPMEQQVQNYAIPANISDPYLRKWIKPDNNPLVVPGPGINATQFRDPTTAWWNNGHWKMLVGSRRHMRGVAYLYRSRDFIKWTKAQHPLHSAPNTGMWECPDFYPVPLSGKKLGLDASFNGPKVKHILKVSLDLTRYEYYTVGTYFPRIDKYVPDNTSVDGWAGLRYDYGNFYASKSFYDAEKKRRILWGWANESDSADSDIQKGWAGIQTIPRSVWLDPNGKQLLQWPIEELEELRGKKVELNKQKLPLGSYIQVKGVTAEQADVDVTFSFSSLDKAEPFNSSWVNAQDLCGIKGSTIQGGVGPFGLLTLASKKLEEYTPVFFRIFKAGENHKVLLCSDARSSSLKSDLYKPSFAGFVDVDLSDKKLSLRSLIDHSVVESYGAGGKTCITSRVYPTLAVSSEAHLFAFNNGSEPITVEKLRAWTMKSPARMN